LQRMGKHRPADHARWHGPTPQPPKSSPTALATTAFDSSTARPDTLRGAEHN
jgi:hypothetical protein